MEKENQSYEKFGCCAFWQKCNHATACVHQSTAPNKMKACGLYRRHARGEDVQPLIPVETEELVIVQPSAPVTEASVTANDDDFTQLSLF